MRRFLYFVVTAGLVAATAVALASASRTAPRATGESANAYLPKGMKPLVNDWNHPGGDAASTMYSQLKEINSSNVGGLKVVWNGSYRGTAASTLQQAPICCPSGKASHTSIPARTAPSSGRGQAGSRR